MQDSLFSIVIDLEGGQILALMLGWYLKEELRELWNQPSRDAMERFLRDWCQKAAEAGIRQLGKMAKTLLLHASRHSRLRHSQNHQRAKKSYGFRDEEFPQALSSSSL